MLERISYFASNSSSSVEMLIAIVVMGVAGVAAVYYVWDMLNKQGHVQTAHPDRPLWEELCELHQVNKEEQILLMRLGHLQQLPQKELIFVRPDLFSVTGTELEARQAQLDALKARLIG